MSNQDRAAKVIQETYALGGASQDAAKALAEAGLLMPDDMDWQEADYRPPRFYTLYETTEKGPNLGDHVTRAKRLVGPWEEA